MNRLNLFVLLICLFFFPTFCLGQSGPYTMSTTPLSTCSGTWYDPGGTSNYTNNLDITQTICSNNGQSLKVVFSQFSLSAGDFLYVYEGNSITSLLVGVFTGTSIPGQITATGGCLTFRFTSNSSGVSSGWVATLSCHACVTMSSLVGSPCAPFGANPFCTDENPYGVTYSSGTSGTANSFFGGSGSVGCLGSVPCPAWYYMRIDDPGNLLIYIEQESYSGSGLDVDFACWGPFTANSETDFLEKLCCGHLNLYTTYTSSHRPTNGNHNGNMGGYPVGNLIDCSYYGDYTEWCYIPNAISGQWYILLITNFSQNAGTITFSPVAAQSTATTDCSLLAVTSSNSPVCVGDSLFLICQNPIEDATYSWTGPNNWSSNSEQPVIPNASLSNAGDYTLVMTVSGQASDPAVTTVEVNENPTVIITPSSPSICFEESVTLTASGADTYSWDNGMVNTASYVVSPTTTTSYVVYGVAEGCMDSATVEVMVSTGDSTFFEEVICFGDGFEGHGFSIPNVTEQGVFEYFNTLVNSSGCDSVLVLSLRVPQQLDLDSVNIVNETCNLSNASIELFPQGGIAPYSFVWENSDTTSSLLSNIDEGFYAVQVLDSINCTAETDFEILNSIPVISIQEIHAAHCGNPDGEITLSTINGTGTYSYDWGTIQDFIDNRAFNLYPGNYVVVVDDSICQIDFPFVINDIPAPVACFSISNAVSPIVSSPLSFFDCSTNASIWNWSFGDNTYSSFQNTSHIYHTPSTYLVSLVVGNDYDCWDTADYELTIYDVSTCYVPSSFTPNGDGLNDIFQPSLYSVLPDDYSLAIYDRWGKRVFHTSDINQGWNGTVNGEQLPNISVFNYVLTYRVVEGTLIRKTGVITVLPNSY